MFKIKGPTEELKIRRKLEDVCYRVPDEEVRAALPGIQNQYHTVKLAPAVMKKYKKLEDEFFLEVGDDKDILADNAAVLSGKLQQFCNGAVYDEERNVNPVHDEKIQMLDALVEDLGDDNAIVVYAFQHDLARLQAWREAPVFKSGLPTKQFNQLLADWNAGNLPVVYGHPKSMGHGLNLQHGGHHIIFFGVPWSLEQYEQTIGRLARSGQKQSTVFVHHIVVQDTIETGLMIPRLRERDASQQAFLRHFSRWRKA
jgi:SNF2 family DNA or RNA helicase